MVQINGESVDAAGKVLKEYLEENNYITEGIAVECNEKIIPKQKYNEFTLSDGDIVEIVSFVGGGQPALK
ncbi:MAG: sulfur carrier protein ThiS [Lachnospiraceae bacterium]|nr:sulfur carrier protein ThiS [Lachnospiraceae bacterium]